MYMVSEEKKQEIKNYREQMKEAEKYLPINWIQKILGSKKLSSGVYKKQYNVLVNMKNGRSFASIVKYPELYEEILALARKYKSIV